MADLLVAAQPRKSLVDELGAVVRSEALDAVTNAGQEYLRCRGHVGRALAPEGVEPSHARRVVLEHDQGPTVRRDVPRAGKVNENALKVMRHPRGSRRRYRRTPTLRLHATTACNYGARELNALLLGRFAQKALVSVGIAHVEDCLLYTSPSPRD